MFSNSSGYLVSLCISVGMMSLSCSLRHWGLLSASWKKHSTHLCLGGIYWSTSCFSHFDFTSMLVPVWRSWSVALFSACFLSGPRPTTGDCRTGRSVSGTTPPLYPRTYSLVKEEKKRLRLCKIWANWQTDGIHEACCLHGHVTLTHSVEQRCADWFDNEVVFQAQFLQAFIKVIWIHKQMDHLSKPCRTALGFYWGGGAFK